MSRTRPLKMLTYVAPARAARYAWFIAIRHVTFVLMLRFDQLVQHAQADLAERHLDGDPRGIPRVVLQRLLDHLALGLGRELDGDVAPADGEHLAHALAQVGVGRLLRDDERVGRDAGEHSPAQTGP